jgi:hypothetical protein
MNSQRTMQEKESNHVEKEADAAEYEDNHGVVNI